MTDHAKKQVQRRQKLRISKRRRKLLILLTLILVCGSGVFLFRHHAFHAVSEVLVWIKDNKPGEVAAFIPSVAPRGDIYDRNFRPLAATYETYAVYARPLEMENPAASAAELEKILGLEENSLWANLKSERGFVWIARGIDQELAEAITQKNIAGTYQVVETKRFYPNYETAAHAVGFVEEDQGLDGIEFQYNSLLRGDEISKAELETLHFDSPAGLGQTASHLVLNLDLLIQSKIEHYLKKRVKITGAATGSVLLMDTATGGILAMASFPTFNPNRYWEFSSSALHNHVVTERVYPGELALLFQQAAAINLRNERKSMANGQTAAEPIPVIEPETLKRKKLSFAPKVDGVDPEYLSRFANLLRFDKKPVTDIPLRDETPAASVALTDPTFHTSALRLLTGFTALVNNGKIVTPHLLSKAYTKGDTTPVAPTLADSDQAVSLHPDTSKDLLHFLAVKWLKINGRDKLAQTPMFIEAHRFAPSFGKSAEPQGDYHPTAGADLTPRIMQSVMLGAIPGKDPKLTMIAVLTYPDDQDDVYPDALEAFGNNFSILSPDQDMIRKMLYVADQPSPIPSPDFWDSSGGALTKNIDPATPEQKNLTAAVNHKKYMPDVTGKSLRAGLQALQHFNLNIKLLGSGKIILQHPAAGAELKNGVECTLEMQQEI